LKSLIRKSGKIKSSIRAKFLAAYKQKTGEEFGDKLPKAAYWEVPGTLDEMIAEAEFLGILADPEIDPDIRSLREILLYGLKGMAAYADHASVMGSTDEEVTGFFHKGLSALTDNSLSAGDLFNLIMAFGKSNLKCMEILDKAHTTRFGSPVPTKVPLGVKKGPAIVVSGHGPSGLEQLLETDRR